MPKNLVRPTSVWTTGQRSPRQQTPADRYVSAARSDTALTPDLARWVIATYTAAGDLVCDPNPGPGVVLAEALRTGRHTVGLPTQPRWESVLDANLDLARLAGSAGTATLLGGVDDPRAAELSSAVDLVLTGLRHTPTSDPSRVLVGLYEDLNAVAEWVWPGGHIVVTCRPWRRRGHLLDLPGAIHDAAEAIGLVPADHCIALTAPVRDGQVRPRLTRNHLDNGDIHGDRTTEPVHIDLLVFRVPHTAKGGVR